MGLFLLRVLKFCFAGEIDVCLWFTELLESIREAALSSNFFLIFPLYSVREILRVLMACLFAGQAMAWSRVLYFDRMWEDTAISIERALWPYDRGRSDLDYFLAE